MFYCQERKKGILIMNILKFIRIFIIKVLNFIRILFGIICLIEVPVCIYLIFNDLKDIQAAGAFSCVVFALLAYLLLRKKKKKSKGNNSIVGSPIVQNTVEPRVYSLDTPQSTLEEMKSVGHSIHADSVIRAIDESYLICKNTFSLQTFESRLEVATQKAYMLKQMEQAGLYNCEPTSDYYLNLLIGNESELLNDFLLRSYNYTLSKAKRELKTQSGIQRRMTKFISEIEDSVLDFDLSILSVK